MQIWGCNQERSNYIVHEFFKSPHFNDGIPVIPGRCSHCHKNSNSSVSRNSNVSSSNSSVSKNSNVSSSNSSSVDKDGVKG